MSRCVIRSVAKLNGRGSGSPGCSSHFVKSIVRPLRRHGVPVLKMRWSSKPSDVRLSAQFFRRLIAGPAAARLRLAGVHDRLEEGAGREDDGYTGDPIERVAAGPDADDPATRSFAVEDDRLDHLLAEGKVLGLFDPMLERELVELLVRLGPRRMHRGALRLVQHPKLEASDVDDAPHLAAESIDLADDLTLGDAADRGIAAHGPDGVGAHGEESGAQAHPRSREGGLRPRVAGADDDHVVVEDERSHRLNLPFLSG